MRLGALAIVCIALSLSLRLTADEIINQNFTGVVNDLIGTEESDKIGGVLYEGFQSADQSHSGGAVVTEVVNDAIKTQVTSFKQTVSGDIAWDASGLPVNPLTFVEITLPENQGAISSLSYSFGKDAGGYLWTGARYLKDGVWTELFSPVYKGTASTGPWTQGWDGAITNSTKIRIYMWANGGTNPGNITIDDIVVNDAPLAGTTDGVDYVLRNEWSMSGSGSESRWNFNSITSSGASVADLNNNPNTTNSWFVDQTGSHKITTAQGSFFDLTVKTNDLWSGGKVWIDWNHDGFFDEATEMVGYFVDDNADLTNSAYKNFFGRYLPDGGNTLRVYVPLSAELPALSLTTRIRIKTTDVGNYDPDSLLPDDSRLGQAHDYAIEITSDDSVPYAPLTTSVESITPSGFIASWSATSADTYTLNVYRDEALSELLVTVADIATTSHYVDLEESITAPLFFTVTGTNSAGTSSASVPQFVQTPAFIENSIKFDGASNRLEIAGNFSSITDQITVSFWSRGETGLANNFAFFATDSAKTTRWAAAHLPHGGTIYWDAGNADTQRISKGAEASNYSGRWNHWAFTKNATTGEMKIFLNGSEWHSGTDKTLAFDGNIAYLYIACDATGGMKYNGKIARFRVWNVAQDGDTIAAEMYRATPATTEGLVACYNFNDKVDDGSLDDDSGNSLTATVIGSPSIVSSTKAVVSTAPTNIEDVSFTANWDAVEGAEKYFIDVASDSSFKNIYSLHNSVEVSGNSAVIAHGGSLVGTTYYRIRAYSTADGLIGSSNYQTVVSSVPSTDYVVAVAPVSSSTVGGSINCDISVKLANGGEMNLDFDGTHNVKVSNFIVAPDGSYGAVNGTIVTSNELVVPVVFTDGEATIDIAVNAAGLSQLAVAVEDVVTSDAYANALATVELATTNGLVANLEIAQNIDTNENSNGGIFPVQPVVNLYDQFLNLCVADSSTTLTATAVAGELDVCGQTVATANAGVVTFSSLGAVNCSDTDNTIQIKLTESGSGLEVTLTSVLVKAIASGSGNCAVLDGTNYFTITNVDNLTPNSMRNVTIEAWVYFDSLPVVDSRTAVIGSSDNGSYPGINFGVTSDGALYMYASYFPNTSSRIRDSVGISGKITAGTWNHIAFVYDADAADKFLRFYVNGEDAGSDDLPDTFTTIWDKPISYIGRALVRGGLLAGKIDELKIWNIARSQADISADYESVLDLESVVNPQTRAVSSDDLLAYFNFDNTAGNSVVELVHQDGYAAASADTVTWARSTDIVTPAIGIELVQTGNMLSWTVESEVGIKEYRIVDVATGEVLEVIVATGEGGYSVKIDDAGEMKLVVVDNSGFAQTFLPSDDDTVKVVYHLQSGWNLVAMPGDKADVAAFESPLWGWNGSAYEFVEAPAVGNAVWVHSDVERQVVVSAQRAKAELSLQPGWNMVGPTENVKVPAEAEAVFGWSETYQNIATEDGVLLQGVGYWIFSQ